MSRDRRTFERVVVRLVHAEVVGELAAHLRDIAEICPGLSSRVCSRSMHRGHIAEISPRSRTIDSSMNAFADSGCRLRCARTMSAARCATWTPGVRGFAEIRRGIRREDPAQISISSLGYSPRCRLRGELAEVEVWRELRLRPSIRVVPLTVVVLQLAGREGLRRGEARG